MIVHIKTLQQLRITILFFSGIMALCTYCAPVCASELLSEEDATRAKLSAANFFKHAKVQPKELQDATIVDLHYNTNNGNTVIACTGAQGSHNYLSLYDPQAREVIHTIIARDEAPHVGKISGSFSKNGEYFTAGTIQKIHQPQQFFIFQKTPTIWHGVIQECLGNSDLAQIVCQYIGNRAYTYSLAREISYNPSLWSYVRLPDMEVSHFQYNPQANSIACFGNPISHQGNLLRSLWNQYQLGRHGHCSYPGAIAPVGVINLSNNRIKILNPHKTCHAGTMQFSSSQQNKWADCTTSTNMQHIVYRNSKDHKYHILNRTNNSDKVATSATERPLAIDNTGTLRLDGDIISIQKSFSHTKESDRSLNLLPLIRNSSAVSYSCIYPHPAEDTILESIHLDKNYCFIQSCYQPTHLHNGRWATEKQEYALGISIPQSQSEDESSILNDDEDSTKSEYECFDAIIDRPVIPLTIGTQSTITRKKPSRTSRLYPYVLPCMGLISSIGIDRLSASQFTPESPSNTISLKTRMAAAVLGICGTYYSLYTLYKRFTRKPDHSD